MAHVLLGWELGANRGHVLRLYLMGKALREAGHRVTFAIQRIDGLSEAEAGGSPVWQAPLTPRLLISGAMVGGVTVGMADILGRLGFDDRAIVATMINGWHHMLAAIRPDIVLGEYAPFLMLAARGRLPTMSIGTAFSQPPATMPQLPSLIDGPGAIDQAALLGLINCELARVGTAPMQSVAQVFEADVMIADSFAELDPYAAHRAIKLASPLPTGFDAHAGAGKEVFVYAPERMALDSPLWRGLAASGLPIRVHPYRAHPALVEALVGYGFAVEPNPIPWTKIAERSRMVVSHGGHGFICSALAAGLPQVVFHFDLEKILHGLAVARQGLGGHVALANLNPERFGADLAALYRDEALTERARAKAVELGSGNQPDPIAEVVAGVQSLS